MGSKKRNKRIIVVVVLFILLGGLSITKLFFIQIIQSDRLAREADRQYAPSASYFDRGKIYATTKDGEQVELASVAFGYKLAIVPGELTNDEEVYETLSAITPINREEFLFRSSKKLDPYEEIKTRLSKEEADAIREAKLPGVRLYEHTWRTYPSGTVAAKVLGFVGFKGDTLTGRYGLEQEYNDVLSRNSKESPYVNFFAEIFADIRGAFSNKAFEGNIITTIEPTVQGYSERLLEQTKNKFRADEAGLVVMNPNDGSIISMTTLPSFDPNTYSKVSNISVYNNQLVENVYELGSVVKALTMAAGLDSGAVTPETTYDDKGYVQVENTKIHNFDRRGRGLITMQDVLNESLNTGVVLVQQRMGEDAFRDYFYSLGLNAKTDIDLPGEAQSIVTNLESPRKVEYATASFGQGIALTPIAALRAFSALAHDGWPVKPHVVKEIRYPSGLTKQVGKKEVLPQALSDQTTRTISRMLVKAFDQSAAGVTSAKRTGVWSIAAKTGTAQIPNQEEGGYYTDRYLHSMVGYFPAYDPEFVALIYLVNPKDAPFSSQTVAYTFADLAHYLLTYYQIPPDR